MTLYIDTTQKDLVKIVIKDDDREVAVKEFNAQYSQAEKLLPAIDKILSSKKIKLSDLTKIEVANEGGSFTSLRIGILTANALGYALGIPVVDNDKKFVKAGKFSVINPIYDKEPNITKPKAKKCV